MRAYSFKRAVGPRAEDKFLPDYVFSACILYRLKTLSPSNPIIYKA